MQVAQHTKQNLIQEESGEMNSRLHKEILTETYKDMRGLVSETAYKFWRAHGGDLDDLKAQANLIFIEAVLSHDSKRSKITTWVVNSISKGLLYYMRSTWYAPTHVSIGNGHDDDFELESKSNENLSVMELLDEMEQDAHIILCLFLDTPKEVILNIFDDKNFRLDRTRSRVRNRLRNRLRQMGWTIRRIGEAFDEVKNVTSY